MNSNEVIREDSEGIRQLFPRLGFTLKVGAEPETLPIHCMIGTVVGKVFLSTLRYQYSVKITAHLYPTNLSLIIIYCPTHPFVISTKYGSVSSLIHSA